MKDEQCHLPHLKSQNVKGCSGCWICESRERKCDFSLDFWPFGPLVLDVARSKVDLSGEGYVWTPIWWSSDNSKR